MEGVPWPDMQKHMQQVEARKSSGSVSKKARVDVNTDDLKQQLAAFNQSSFSNMTPGGKPIPAPAAIPIGPYATPQTAPSFSSTSIPAYNFFF